MKKTLSVLFAALSFSLLFTACGFNNLQTPKQVKIKTNAAYEFSVMNFDSEKGSKFDLSKYFDLGKTLEEKTAGSDSSLEIFKYNRGYQYQEFLLHMPLKEVEFDFSESFKDMDFSTATQNFEIKEEVEIPDLDGLNLTPQPIDLTSIKTALNAAATFTGATSSSLQGVNYQKTPAPFNFIKYTSGTLTITAHGTVSGKISLYYDENNDMAVTDSELVSSGTFNSSNVAVLPLDGKILHSERMKVKYEGPSNDDIPYTAVITPTSVIKSAEGINLDSSEYTVAPVDISFNLTVPANVSDLEIESGTISITITNPDSWTDGIIGNYSIELSEAISPTVTVTKTNPSAASATGSLDGRKLQTGNLKALATVPVNLSGGKTIVFDDPPMVSVTKNITGITAGVQMKDDFKTSISEYSAVDDLKNYVKKIYWKNEGAGFVVKAKNTFPAGNDITLKLKSDVLGIAEKQETILANTPDEQTFSFVCGNGEITDFSTIPSAGIDIEGEIGLPTGSSENAIKVTGVVPGETYTISLSVTPKFDWEKAEIQMPSDSSLNQKMNTGMNKHSLFAALSEEFADKVKITSMPFYLYATIPENLASGMNFSGKIKAFYGEENTSDPENPTEFTSPVYILGSDSGAASLSSGTLLPEFTKNEAGEVTTTLGKATFDFADAMNIDSADGTLYLDYDIGLKGSGNSGIEITPDTITSMKTQGKTAIKIDIVLILSMDFTVTDPIEIDLMKLMNKDGDLLGRTEAPDTSAYKPYLDVIENASLCIENLKLPVNGKVSFKAKMTNSSKEKTTSIENGQNFTLDVVPSELLETYPLKPEMKFIIEKGNFSLMKSTAIGGKIKIRMNTNGEIPLPPFNSAQE